MIDILLPVFNGSKYLRQQLDSLLNQSYKNIRVIIRDDLSSDDSRNLIKNYAENTDGKIVYIDSDKNLGSSLSFHELLKQSTADYVMFCDQDDVWLPNKVHDSFTAITNANLFCNNIRCVFTDLVIVDEALNELHRSMRGALKFKAVSDDYRNYLCQSQITGCTMILNRPAVELLKKFPPPNRHIIHDHWYSVIVSIYGEVRYLDKPTILYRQHFNNQVGFKNINLNYFIQKIKAIFKIYHYDMGINYALPKEYQIGTMQWFIRKVRLNLERIN
ncbi:TPA: glycosyltransferase family 2 protein [Escherichia coli]|uniref:glycosyltransferase family 2 protein n=1 Tax=Escherichia TaxID=561 RepID=UPI0013EEB310|nr:MULTISPECIES: glycosyltransferase family 2 protein [Escherichia]EFP6099816.1 glycosyltransferase family 2 protein [Shigella boydii]EFZ1809736.1 glycosyltransferase family 2 protein [Shigella boydii]EFZ1893633.1 glycosyltransferase family 2 protein [Shigella boydii]EFZ5005667.1 glycosyltransferase family 2 protein [Shigella boydii]EGK3645700.1 glycosyltransferase family 2 protein [Escherichia coli]